MPKHDEQRDAAAALVERALAELVTVQLPPPPLRLDARLLLAKSQIVRRAQAERQMLAPISTGVPLAIGAGALVSAVALVRHPAETVAGALAGQAALALLVMVFLVACLALSTSDADKRMDK